MRPSYINQLSLNQKHKGVPYGGSSEIRNDGDANYGFKDVKGNCSLISEIPELKRDSALMSLIQAINAPTTGLFSIGCVSGSVEDESGFRNFGYVEFSINSISAIADAKNYFSLFFHFDSLLHANAVQLNVAYSWELQPVTFIEAEAAGFTCSVFINTNYSPIKTDVEDTWNEALDIFGAFLGSVPKEREDIIYGR